MLKRTLLLSVLTGGAVGAGLVPARGATCRHASGLLRGGVRAQGSEGIKPYSAGVAGTFEPFGGRFVVRGGKIAALEGPPPGSRTVIIEFPSMERARAWYDSDAYRNLRPVRQRSDISRTYIIEGLPG